MQQRWPNILVEFDAIARSEKHFERIIGEGLRMSRRGEQIALSARCRKKVRSWPRSESSSVTAARSARIDSML